MRRFGFCDRCGKYTQLPETMRVCVCYDCELGMNSIGAMLDPPWARPMTSSEIHLACAWAIVEQGKPEKIA